MSDVTDTLADISTAPLADIEPYSDNPLNHDDEQIDSLKESICKFGFKSPILIGSDGEIVSGHGRYEAVQALRDSEQLADAIADHADSGNAEIVSNLETLQAGSVYVLQTGDLTDDERDEFRIADNKVFEHSTWDRDSLTFELRELESAVGFGDDEVSALVDTTPGEIDYEPGEVQAEKDKLEAHYEELSEQKRDRKAKLPCPHCDETMFLDKPELKRALKRAFDEGKGAAAVPDEAADDGVGATDDDGRSIPDDL